MENIFKVFKKRSYLDDAIIRARREEELTGNYKLVASPQAERLRGSTGDVLYLIHLMEEWDELPMPVELGKFVEEMIEDPNISFGLHRTPVFGEPLENDMVHSIINEGLINNGDMGSGAYSECPPPNKTVSFCKSELNANIMLKSTYKGSNVAFLVAYPSNLVDQDGNIITDDIDAVYTSVQGRVAIRPEYIVGVVVKNGEDLSFYRTEDLKSVKKY